MGLAEEVKLLPGHPCNVEGCLWPAWGIWELMMCLNPNSLQALSGLSQPTLFQSFLVHNFSSFKAGHSNKWCSGSPYRSSHTPHAFRNTSKMPLSQDAQVTLGVPGGKGRRWPRVCCAGDDDPLDESVKLPETESGI